MCGRCMKTCPWNLEGLFAEAPFRWAAMNVPRAAPLLARIDDAVENGSINPVKKWWWDLEIVEDGSYRPTTHQVNTRGLQKDLDLKYEDQTLAVYPAPLAPHPWPFPFPMDREKGIEAYQAMVTADEYKAKLSRGERDHLHEYVIQGDAPVIRVEVAKAEVLTPDITLYELRALDDADLPAWTAGAHLDVVVAPDYLRQYSLCGDPADRKIYRIAVLREDAGKGGSKLMHRIFAQGRKIFISHPINHFPLEPATGTAFLMGGGIGITPMIAMAHELHAHGAPFAMHYSCATRAGAAFLPELQSAPWADRVKLHLSDEGTRADLDTILAGYAPGDHVYTCGPDRYMQGVMDSATRQGFPDESRHLEYFSVPDVPDYVNHDFTLVLSKSRRRLEVPKDKSAADILNQNGIPVDVKCSDGICGVCKCGLVSGDVEHRDFVLSKAQRETAIILCQSRASAPDGVLEIDL